MNVYEFVSALGGRMDDGDGFALRPILAADNATQEVGISHELKRTLAKVHGTFSMGKVRRLCSY